MFVLLHNAHRWYLLGGDNDLITGIDGVDQTPVLFGSETSEPERDYLVLQLEDLLFHETANYSNSSAAIRYSNYIQSV